MPAGSLAVTVTPDGPVATLEQARDLVRERRAPGQPAVVLVAPGRYPVTRPLRLGPQDSWTTFTALEPGNPPVIDGATALTAWRPTRVRGTEVWAAPAPAPLVRSLFVDGTRRPRPRHPHDGFLRIAGQSGLELDAGMVEVLYNGADQFTYQDADAWSFHDLEQVDAVVPHYWVQERMPLAGVDTARRLVRSTRRSIFALRDDAAQRFARYYFDNVYEALGGRPGEWYLDRQHAQVLYVPHPHDRIDRFQADLPLVTQFVIARGDPAAGAPLQGVRLEGLVFRHADWEHPTRSSPPFQIPEDGEIPQVPYASAPQAAANVDAVLEFVGARGCVVTECAVEHVGGYGVELGDGCQDNLVSGNRFVDLGGGGVKLDGAAGPDGPAANRRNTVTDNEIGEGGRVHPQAVGVLARHAADSVIAHNHIHHLFYSGISVGWVWGYADNPSRGNLIEGNHIHHLGDGLLNDMGGVYLLGVQPGTVVRGNHIHDVTCANYGGWGIYLDEGTSEVVVEGNVCHDVTSQGFVQHYGRDNLVRGNLFAFGGQGQVELALAEDHCSFTLEGNILVGAGVAAVVGRVGRSELLDARIRSDRNLFWDVEGEVVFAGNGQRDAAARWSLVDPVPAEAWRAAGRDVHSVVADPGLADLAARRLEPTGTSPAPALGIRVPDVSGAGVRDKRARTDA